MEDVNAGSMGDILAAFVGDDLRGVAIPTEVPFGPYAGTYQFLMLVYSNAAAGETIDFQFYDSDLDVVYNNLLYQIDQRPISYHLLQKNFYK